MPTHQLSLSLISHKVQDSIVEQRASDGYINATAMCQAASKKWSHYYENSSTQGLVRELSADAGIPASVIIQIIKGGDPHLQGTWIHPQLALNLAQWLSPKFALQVSKWVFDWMSGNGGPAKLPFHLERHMLNIHKIPNGYFSVLQEMTIRLVAPMEVNNYRLPKHLMPDVSQAQLFCKHLRDVLGFDTKTLPKYIHSFPDGREVEANLYPIKFLADFHVLMADVWMKERAAGYFKTRDPAALVALDKILTIGQVAPVPKIPANKPIFKKKA